MNKLLPCLGLKMGNGSPNFQKKYMKVNHTIHANRSLCLCTRWTNSEALIMGCGHQHHSITLVSKTGCTHAGVCY